MDDDAERMIARLSPSINRKCEELQEKRKALSGYRTFVFLCVLMLAFPVAFLFFGFSLVLLVVPVTFTAIAFLMLSPILINQQGENTYEHS